MGILLERCPNLKILMGFSTRFTPITCRASLDLLASRVLALPDRGPLSIDK